MEDTKHCRCTCSGPSDTCDTINVHETIVSVAVCVTNASVNVAKMPNTVHKKYALSHLREALSRLGRLRALLEKGESNDKGMDG